MLFWPLRCVLASSSLHEVRGQKQLCPWLTLMNFGIYLWNKVFCRMFGLNVILIMTLSGHCWIINKKIDFFVLQVMKFKKCKSWNPKICLAIVLSCSKNYYIDARDSQQGRDRKTPVLLVAFWNFKLKVLKYPRYTSIYLDTLKPKKSWHSLMYLGVLL